MIQWRKALVGPKATIRQAMNAIAESRCHICLVVDHDDKLLGAVTDGDIRRGIMEGLGVEAPVAQIMATSPVSASKTAPKEALVAMMESKGIREIPLVDDSSRVVGIRFLNPHPEDLPERDNWVVIMAGGQGKRLRPYTENTPKPMLRVGAQPMLETIIGQLMRHGFRRFYLSVNYMAEVIIEHFGDGAAFGADIRYLREDRPLGTAGALSLIEDELHHPLIAINGDVLNLIDFSSLLGFHHDQGSLATMCVRDSEFQIPFGIVNIEAGAITSIVEKPSHKHFINAGVYVLEPKALEYLPQDTRFDMPDLFNTVIKDGHKAAAFPLGEYWADIGNPEDLKQANREFETNFQ